MKNGNPITEMRQVARSNMPAGFARKSKGRCIAPKGRSSRAQVFEGSALVVWLIDNGMLVEAQKVLDEIKLGKRSL